MNISMRFLRCEPSLQTGYVEEADLFYSNSSHWLNDNYSSHLQPMPSHIVMYNGLLEVCPCYNITCMQYTYIHIHVPACARSCLLVHVYACICTHKHKVKYIFVQYAGYTQLMKHRKP